MTLKENFSSGRLPLTKPKKHKVISPCAELNTNVMVKTYLSKYCNYTGCSHFKCKYFQG